MELNKLLSDMSAQDFLNMKNYLLAMNKWDFAAGVAYTKRQSGGSFSMTDHIRAMVLSELSSRISWEKKVAPYINTKVPEIFFGFDAQKLKAADPDKLDEELKKIKLGSQSRLAQMQSLRQNIETLERIEDTYPGGLEAFVAQPDKYLVVAELSGEMIMNKKPGRSSLGRIKLEQMGVALICEYLKNVGIDIVKPDIHLKRFFKRVYSLGRLKYGKEWADSKSKNEHIAKYSDVFEITERLSESTGLPLNEIDAIIWTYCSDDNGQVCAAKGVTCKNGACTRTDCVLRDICCKDFG